MKAWAQTGRGSHSLIRNPNIYPPNNPCWLTELMMNSVMWLMRWHFPVAPSWHRFPRAVTTLPLLFTITHPCWVKPSRSSSQPCHRTSASSWPWYTLCRTCQITFIRAPLDCTRGGDDSQTHTCCFGIITSSHLYMQDTWYTRTCVFVEYWMKTCFFKSALMWTLWNRIIFLSRLKGYIWCYSVFFLLSTNSRKTKKKKTTILDVSSSLHAPDCGPKLIGTYWRHKPLKAAHK